MQAGSNLPMIWINVRVGVMHIFGSFQREKIHLELPAITLGIKGSTVIISVVTSYPSTITLVTLEASIFGHAKTKIKLETGAKSVFKRIYRN